jgi:hypothetical protein
MMKALSIRSHASLLLIVLLALLLSSSCRGTEAVDLSKLKECSDLDKYFQKRISLEGYFGAHRKENLIACYNQQGQFFCLVGFASQPDVGSDIDASVARGANPNQLKELPEGRLWTIDEQERRRISEALRFITNDGQTIGTKDKVRITGEVSSGCIISVEKIEKL